MAENGKSEADQEGGVPGFPRGGKFFNLSEFEGINTRSPRTSIKDQEMAWVENLFPIANGNLRTLPGLGSSIYTAPNGKTIVYFFFYNFSTTQYCFVVLSDGTGYQVNVANGAITTISATAGTFYNGTSFPGCAQWAAQFLLITTNVAANSYYIWDGATLYGSGGLSPLVNVVNGGNGYTVAPTVTISGGNGSGATGVATLTSGSVTSVTITNAGSGFLVGDKPQISFSGTAAAGAVTGITVVNGGYNYTSAPTVTISGGGGSGATATANISGGSVTSFTITSGGAGYTSTPTVSFSGGGGSATIVGAVQVSTVASATVSVMPFGVSGSGIETYLSRVWLINGNKLQVTDPSSITAFNTVTISTDSFQKIGYVSIKQSNGFLYLLSDSSINTVSNVTSSGSPSITTFQNSNVDPQVGTPWPNSVVAFGRDILLANTNGIYAMFGSAAEKVSEKLDGIFAGATLPTSGISTIPCAAAHTLYNIKIYALLITCIDPFTGSSVPKMMCWDGKKWFVASQEVTLTYITTQEVNSDLQAFGTDGNNIYPLFYTPSPTLTKKLQTRLWPGESYLIDKQILRMYIEGFDNVGAGFTLAISVDTENGSTQVTQFSSGGIVNFFNNSGGLVQFQNSLGQNIYFTVPGDAINGMNVDSVYGKRLGLSFTSTSTDFTIENLSILYRNYHFYG